MAVIGNLATIMSVNSTGLTTGLTGASKSFSGFGSSIAGLASKLGPLAAGLAGIGAALGGRAAVQAAQTQIDAEKKLASVLEATGGAAGLTAQEIAQYASELQSMTNFGDEATINAAALLGTFKEIKGEVFKDAIVAMQDMAAVMGTDVSGGAVQLGKALNDPIRGMAALSKVGVAFTDEQREQITNFQEMGDIAGAQRVILNELKGEFGGAAAGMSDPITQAKNVLGDVAEIVGFVLLPPLREFGAAFTDSIGPITNSRETAEALGETLAGLVKTGITPIANGFKVMAEFVVEATDAIAFGFRNASDLASLAMIDLSLAIFDLIPGTEMVVEEVAGTLVALWDASAAAGAAFVQNVIGGFNEIKNVAAAVWESIVAGMDAILAGENPLEAITQGFLDTLASQENAVSGGNPLTAFADTFKDTRANIQLGFEETGLADSLRAERERIEQSIAANESAFQAGSDTIAQGITAGLMGVTEEAAEMSKLQPLEGPGALQRGSSDAFSAVLSAMRGESRDPQAETAKTTKEMLAEQKRATQELRKLSKGTTFELIAGSV